MTMSTVISAKTVKRLRIAIMVCPVGGDHWFQLSKGTWLRKTERTFAPTYNPSHASFDVYRVMDGEYQGTDVYRTGQSMEEFLQVDEFNTAQDV